jgi:hypothetical protein
VGSVPSAVPSAVAFSAGNSVPVNGTAQRKPYKPMTGSQRAPKVPVTEADGQPLPNPKFRSPAMRGTTRQSGNPGAPSVPRMGGALFTPGPVDPHYTSEFQGSRDPYGKVNNPPTRGMFTRVQRFVNHIAQAPQDVDPNGFRISPAQQRTSVMRNQLPPVANGYSPETYTPAQQPQAVRFNRIGFPVRGSDPYGNGVLNADMYGAGQTAGGVGGNQYTPAAGPPATTSTAAAPSDGSSGMPSWG